MPKKKEPINESDIEVTTKLDERLRNIKTSYASKQELIPGDKLKCKNNWTLLMDELKVAGRKFMNKNEFGKAVKMFDGATSLCRLLSRFSIRYDERILENLHASTSKCCYDLNDYSKSIGAARAALKINSGCGRASFWLSKSLLKLEQYDKALEAITLSINSTDTEISVADKQELKALLHKIEKEDADKKKKKKQNKNKVTEEVGQGDGENDKLNNENVTYVPNIPCSNSYDIKPQPNKSSLKRAKSTVNNTEQRDTPGTHNAAAWQEITVNPKTKLNNLVNGATGGIVDFQEGDWMCPSCQHHNFARRSDCNRCNKPIPDNWQEGLTRGFELSKATKKLKKAQSKETMKELNPPATVNVNKIKRDTATCDHSLHIFYNLPDCLCVYKGTFLFLCFGCFEEVPVLTTILNHHHPQLRCPVNDKHILSRMKRLAYNPSVDLSPQSWAIIRVPPKLPGTLDIYKCCVNMNSSVHTRTQYRCTFAHSDVECAVWNLMFRTEVPFESIIEASQVKISKTAVRNDTRNGVRTVWGDPNPTWANRVTAPLVNRNEVTTPGYSIPIHRSPITPTSERSIGPNPTWSDLNHRASTTPPGLASLNLGNLSAVNRVDPHLKLTVIDLQEEIDWEDELTKANGNLAISPSTTPRGLGSMSRSSSISSLLSITSDLGDPRSIPQFSSVWEILNEFSGLFLYLCKKCFQENHISVMPVAAPCCSQSKQHKLSMLFHKFNIGEVHYIPIRVPQVLHKKAAGFKLCWKNGHKSFNDLNSNCNYSHSRIEQAVWNFHRRTGISFDVFVRESSWEFGEDFGGPVKRAADNLSVVRQSAFPYRAMFTCCRCWMNYRKISRIAVTSNEEKCENSGHRWDPVCLVLNQTWELVHNLPRKKFSFVMCCNLNKRGKCNYEKSGGKCMFAHSKLELDVWTFMKHRGYSKMADFVQASVESFRNNRPRQTSESSTASAVNRISVRPQTLSIQQPAVSLFYCELCHEECKQLIEFQQHCTTSLHQCRATSDKDREWSFRSPPWGNAADYSVCQLFLRGLCPNMPTPTMDSKCLMAHSKDELNEWKERQYYRVMKLDKIKQRGLTSYMDNLLDDYQKTSNKLNVMAPERHATVLNYKPDLKVWSSDHSLEFMWTITIATLENVDLVALLYDIHRTNFQFIIGPSTQPNSHNYQIIDAQSLDLTVGVDNRYTIQIYFHAETYGTYRQSVVVDFGVRPVLELRLNVDMGTEISVIEIERQRSSYRTDMNWTAGNCDIIPYKPTEEVIHEEYHVPPIEALFSTSQIADIDKNNYAVTMHKLLWLEEQSQTKSLSSLNTRVNMRITDTMVLPDGTHLSTGSTGQMYATAYLPDADISMDDINGTLIRMSVFTVLVAPAPDETKARKAYEAEKVCMKCLDDNTYEIGLHLSCQTCDELQLRTGMDLIVDLQFVLHRSSLADQHTAVDHIKPMHLEMLFPNLDNGVSKYISEYSIQQMIQCATDLNEKQKLAVQSIISKPVTTLINHPLVIYGAWGTGKTHTIAIAVKHILNNDPSTRILICTRSNSGSDVYIERYFHEFVSESENRISMLRMYQKDRKLNTVSPTVRLYCYYDPSNNSFAIPPADTIDQMQIVQTTLAAAIELLKMKLKTDFDYIIVDEASQVLETLSIIPICLASSKTRIIVVGDPMQISPVVYSPEAKGVRFECSLLERLYMMYSRGGIETLESNVFFLTENYRSCPEIVLWIGQQFYNCTVEFGSDCLVVANPEHCYPLMFHAIIGSDEEKDFSSMSYSNVKETQEIVHLVKEIIKTWSPSWGPLDHKQICVITCYSQQIRYIRQMLRQERLNGVSVENIQNVQGKEFRVVLISTVRTHTSLSDTLQPHQVEQNGILRQDYISDPRLVNTTMTRARSLVVVVGDPLALCFYGNSQGVWQNYIKVCMDNGSFLPRQLTWENLENLGHSLSKISPPSDIHCP